MNHKILFYFCLCALAAGLVSCNRTKGYRIEGEVPDSTTLVVLRYNTPDGTMVRDTADIADGHYCFEGTVPDVVLGDILILREGREPFRQFLYVENAPLKVADGKVTGGPNNDFMRSLDEVNDDLDPKAAGYRERLTELMNEHIYSHPDVEAAAFMYYLYNRDTPVETYEEGFNHFTEKVKNSDLARQAREEIVARKATAPGAVAPDFTLNDPEGKPVTLSSLRGQYVLVDFWASWCKPCRAGIPGLKELYAKYHDKGFEILGVSDDSKEEAWKKALEEEQMPWIHVCDEYPVKNQPSRVGNLYGVHYIPCYYLLDKEGRIIGKMDHDELALKLAELLD